MWLMTKFGFFSIVEKYKDKENSMLTIRGRILSDFDALRQFSPQMTEVISTTDADYPYRTRIPKKDFAIALFKIAMNIDYSNYKNEVLKTQGHDRACLYSEVWAILRNLENIQ